MKHLIAILIITFSVNSFAEVMNCSGTKDGKSIVFSIEKNEASEVKSISATVDGVLVSQGLSEISNYEIAMGNMITASQPNAIAIDDIKIFIDTRRSCFSTDDASDTSCYLGWINRYHQNMVIRGVKLKCE